jgi:hypothetical protein
MTAPPAPLRYLDKPVAEACFRSLLWFRGTLDDPDMAGFASDLAGWFWRTHGHQVGLIQVASKTISGRPRRPGPEVLADVGKWIKEKGKPDAAEIQMQGPDVYDEGPARVPWLHLSGNSGVVLAEVCLAHDLPDLNAHADAMAALADRPGLICGLQGMGYYLPYEKHSVVSVLPRASSRYKAAIEILLNDPLDGLTAENLGFYWDDPPDLLPGLPDIGWRTILGPALAARVGTLPEQPGVTVERGAHCVALTAGPRPIWGDVNAAEDISAFRAVAAALAPIAMPRTVTDSRYFTGDPDDADHMDRLDAYLARFA